MPSANRTLRLNLGDPSEARVYFLPHCVAQALGLFAQEGLGVDFVQSQAGGDTPMGGQVAAVLSGEADLAVGGPMVAMKLQAEGEARLRLVCGLVRANPWVLAARQPWPDFTLAALAGKTVHDIGRVTTATLCLRWLLAGHGLAEGAATITPGSGDEAGDLASFLAGNGDVVHHSLHVLAPLLADGRLTQILPLAGPMGPAPWSAYIARADVLGAKRALFDAFLRAMRQALRMVATMPADGIAAMVAPFYPGYPRAGLTFAIAQYRASAVWSADGAISRAELSHFGRIMRETGWLAHDPDAAALIDRAIAA